MTGQEYAGKLRAAETILTDLIEVKSKMLMAATINTPGYVRHKVRLALYRETLRTIQEELK